MQALQMVQFVLVLFVLGFRLNMVQALEMVHAAGLLAV